MYNQLEQKSRSYYSFLAIGSLSLLALIFIQTFGLTGAASANSRDEFPGRRQGGGTHWVTPSTSLAE